MESFGIWLLLAPRFVGCIEEVNPISLPYSAKKSLTSILRPDINSLDHVRKADLVSIRIHSSF